MNKTKIEWVKNPDGSQGHSWNPIKGLCPVGCWYCYGKRYYERFWHLHGYPVKFYENEIEQIYELKKPSGIFLCSVFEIFHDITKTEFKDSGEQWTNWRDCIFDTIEDNLHHRFYILTKFPQDIDRPMPDNAWLGVTITRQDEMWRMGHLKKAQAKIKFISFEPLLSSINMKSVYDHAFEGINWIIVGALTGKDSKKCAPKKEWIQEFLELTPLHIKIFLKDNLKEIYGEPLIQEMPE